MRRVAIIASASGNGKTTLGRHLARELGTTVLDGADAVLWLDLPTRVWLPRLLRRTARRPLGRETLCGPAALAGRDRGLARRRPTLSA